MKTDVRGIIPPLSTPVTENEEPDLKAMKKLVRHVLAGGVHGVFAMGSMGGYGFFNQEQKVSVGETVVEEVNGRVPVFFGVSDTGTRKVIENIKTVEKIGVDAVVVCLPYYFPPDRKQIRNHFFRIAGESSLPLYLYNIPSVSGVNMELDLICELSQLENIKGIKDSSGDFSFFLEIIRTLIDNDFAIYAGDEKGIAQSLISGATGSVVGTADLAPGLAVSIYNAVEQGEIDKAVSLQREWSALWQIHTAGDVFGAHNYALSLIGIGSGHVMPPCRELKDKKARLQVRTIMENTGII